LNFLSDFFLGRTNKLSRDFLGAALAIIMFCVGAVSVLNTALEAMRAEMRQTLPPRIANQGGPVATQEIVRSVLDDNPTTASVGTRSILTEPKRSGQSR
jgi:hypothetical protein